LNNTITVDVDSPPPTIINLVLGQPTP
jgi:hypothetical protein